MLRPKALWIPLFSDDPSELVASNLKTLFLVEKTLSLFTVWWFKERLFTYLLGSDQQPFLGSLNHSKKVTKNCQVFILYIHVHLSEGFKVDCSFLGFFWFRFSENLSAVSIPRPRATWSSCSFGQSPVQLFVDLRDDLHKTDRGSFLQNEPVVVKRHKLRPFHHCQTQRQNANQNFR